MRKAHILLQGHLRCHPLAVSLVKDRSGLEIGGPSEIFRKKQGLVSIYDCVGSLDNCDIASETAWGTHSGCFQFSNGKAPGKNIFCDGSALREVGDGAYEFLLSSHNLEHFANPVKALKEWQRVVVKGGTLILVLPNYRHTFDHRRKPTSVAHMLADFENDTGEDDLTHLQEILEHHDLSLDPPAGTLEKFRKRSLANHENRCLHHHVFNEENSPELLTTLGLQVLAVEAWLPVHLFLVARMP